MIPQSPSVICRCGGSRVFWFRTQTFMAVFLPRLACLPNLLRGSSDLCPLPEQTGWFSRNLGILCTTTLSHLGAADSALPANNSTKAPLSFFALLLTSSSLLLKASWPSCRGLSDLVFSILAFRLAPCSFLRSAALYYPSKHTCSLCFSFGVAVRPSQPHDKVLVGSSVCSCQASCDYSVADRFLTGATRRTCWSDPLITDPPPVGWRPQSTLANSHTCCTTGGKSSICRPFQALLLPEKAANCC